MVFDRWGLDVAWIRLKAGGKPSPVQSALNTTKIKSNVVEAIVGKIFDGLGYEKTIEFLDTVLAPAVVEKLDTIVENGDSPTCLANKARLNPIAAVLEFYQGGKALQAPQVQFIRSDVCT